ncbi:head-tail connector protein [Bacillus phage vB_BceH_LY2]|nr:head-tail connector protein [Bacillus phage vB_BceH_LY2]
MLPSIDTYLYDEIEAKLGIILSERYIIEEILKGLSPDISSRFIKAYTGDTALDIPIVYTMPQDKQMLRGAIYIGLREGEESFPSIGNKEGTYSFPEGDLIKETSTVQVDTSTGRMYFELSKPIGDIEGVHGIAFGSNEVKIEGNRMYFDYSETLENTPPFTIYYTEKAQGLMSGKQGIKQGFTTTEHYSILVISTNMDTVRCLDLIMKAILILMRSNEEEHTNNLLQKIKFGQIEEINTGTGSDGQTPEILYGRETIVTYTPSYSLDSPILKRITEFNINSKLTY